MENKVRKAFYQTLWKLMQKSQRRWQLFFLKEHEHPVIKATFWLKIMSAEMKRVGRIILHDFVGS